MEPESEEAALPDDVSDYLRSRRDRFKGTGLDYLERRTQTGPDVGS